MTDEPQDKLPKTPLNVEDAKAFVVLIALVIGLWVGGTVAAHWIWDISWWVAALIVPAGVGVLLGVLKLASRRR
jgi:fatty acid desaturase